MLFIKMFGQKKSFDLVFKMLSELHNLKKTTFAIYKMMKNP